MFPDAMEKSPQVGDELKSPQLGDESDVALVFRIPWGHNKLIICRIVSKKPTKIVKNL